MKTGVKYMVIYRHKNKYSISEIAGSSEYPVSRIDIPAWNLPLAEKVTAELQLHSDQDFQLKTKLTPMEQRSQFVA